MNPGTGWASNSRPNKENPMASSPLDPSSISTRTDRILDDEGGAGK